MRAVAAVFFVLALCAGRATAAPQKYTFTDTAMGTVVSVFFWTDNEPTARHAADAVFVEMKRLDAMMTTWTQTSEVSQINNAAGKAPVVVSDETFAVIARAQNIARKTNGVFDITVGAFKGLWKFDEDMDGTLPDPKDVKARLNVIGYRSLVLDEKNKTVFLKKAGMSITLGGIAKGYAVDKCATLLRAKGYKDFMIQAGGDMYVAGDKSGSPWLVGIRDPRGPHDQMFARGPVSNHSFSTSGDYERGFVKNGVRYHHILDPRNGQPARASRSVTIRATDAFTADAWSKVLFILGYEKSLALIKREKLTDFEVVWVTDKNEVKMTPGMQSFLTVLQKPTAGP